MEGENAYVNVFRKNVEFYVEFIRRLEECVGNFVKILSTGMNPYLSAGSSPYHILDLGGGNGGTMAKLLGAVQSFSGRPIRLDYLDPSMEMEKLFQQRMSSDGLQGVVNEVFVERWEEHEPRRQYDFILSCESWFGIGEWEKSLGKLHGAIKTGGNACIVIESEGNDFVRFKKRFLPLLYAGEQSVCGRPICDTLHKMRIPYMKQTEVTQTLDISDVVPNGRGEISENGKSFLSYLIRMDYEELSPKIKQEIGGYFSSQHQNRTFTLENDFIWLGRPA